MHLAALVLLRSHGLHNDLHPRPPLLLEPPGATDRRPQHHVPPLHGIHTLHPEH